jgi:hypothetical protein
MHKSENTVNGYLEPNMEVYVTFKIPMDQVTNETVCAHLNLNRGNNTMTYEFANKTIYSNRKNAEVL